MKKTLVKLTVVMNIEILVIIGIYLIALGLKLEKIDPLVLTMMVAAVLGVACVFGGTVNRLEAVVGYAVLATYMSVVIGVILA